MFRGLIGSLVLCLHEYYSTSPANPVKDRALGCLPIQPQMLRRLPAELRLEIFRYVFGNIHGEIILVEKIDGAIILRPDKSCRFKENLEKAILYLHPDIVGSEIAIEAAEALFNSDYTFRVNAEQLPEFLTHCPFSCPIKPGEFISKLQINMDEDTNFIGDGPDRQLLRKADWVDLNEESDDELKLRSQKRTKLMRRYWKAVLKMPRLSHFEFHIAPAGGKMSAKAIQSWEVRDILPMFLRL